MKNCIAIKSKALPVLYPSYSAVYASRLNPSYTIIAHTPLPSVLIHTSKLDRILLHKQNKHTTVWKNIEQ